MDSTDYPARNRPLQRDFNIRRFYENNYFTCKKMNTDTDSFSFIDYPIFLNRTEELLSILKTMSNEQLKNLWKCNDNIANLNYERLNKMDLRKNLTPAIIAYEGIQYQYMAPSVFTEKQLSMYSRV